MYRAFMFTHNTKVFGCRFFEMGLVFWTLEDIQIDRHCVNNSFLFREPHFVLKECVYVRKKIYKHYYWKRSA